MNQCVRPLVFGDPGHGGHETGTAVLGFPMECNHVLHVARKLEKSVKDDPFDFRLTRNSGIENPTEKERGELVAEAGGNLVVSIHVNWHKDPLISRCMVFHNGVGCASDVARAAHLATPSILKRNRASDAVFKTKANDWTRDAHAVLKWHKCPAILVELLHLSNEKDRGVMSDPIIQLAQVGAMRQAILEFMFQVSQ